MRDVDNDSFSYSGELKRKALHLLAVLVPLGAWMLGRDTALVLLVPLTAIAFLLDWLRVRSRVVRQFINRFFGSMMRPIERPDLGHRVVINGATWVLASVTLLIFLFPMPVALTSLVVFMVGDAAAALVGRPFGRRTIPRSGGTLEGTIAFLATGMGAGLVVARPWDPTCSLYLPWIVLCSGVLVAGLLELTWLPVNDNILAPLGAALTMAGLLAVI